MKTSIKYLSVLILIFVISCQKQAHTPDIIYSEGGLISFSTRVETRAPIIEDLNGRNFGVYGYSFSNLTNWNTAKTRATPNVFHNQLVECGENGSCSYTFSPIIVKDDNGNDVQMEYGDLIQGRREWDLSKGYSFLAYFPYNGTGVTPSGSMEMADPFINYNVPLVNEGVVDTDALIDIMTAKRINYKPTQGTTVRFAFSHRLFCIDFYGHNFNTSDIKISDLSVTLSGIEYKSSKIFLDDERKDQNGNSLPTSIPSSEGWSASNKVTFPIISDGAEVILSAGSTASLSTYEVKKENEILKADNNIMLIPQNSSENGGLSVEISFKKNGVQHSELLKSTYKVNFEGGNKYSITINFVGENALLVEAKTAPWESKQVNHTFD